MVFHKLKKSINFSHKDEGVDPPPEFELLSRTIYKGKF